MRDWKSRKARTGWNEEVSIQVETSECFKRATREDIGRLGRQDWDPVGGLSVPLRRWQRAVEVLLGSGIFFPMFKIEFCWFLWIKCGCSLAPGEHRSRQFTELASWAFHLTSIRSCPSYACVFMSTSHVAISGLSAPHASPYLWGNKHIPVLQSPQCDVKSLKRKTTALYCCFLFKSLNSVIAILPRETSHFLS